MSCYVRWFTVLAFASLVFSYAILLSRHLTRSGERIDFVDENRESDRFSADCEEFVGPY